MLSATEIQSTVRWLGWPSKTVDEGSTHYSKIFTDRITTLSDEGIAVVRDLLRKISETEEKIECARCRLAAEKVDGLVMNNREISQLHSLKTHYILELSEFVDLPVLKHSHHVHSLVV